VEYHANGQTTIKYPKHKYKYK